MKSTVYRYGIFASLTLLVLGLVQFFYVAKKADYAVQEAVGYLSIFISMIFVFLGIRHFRDHEKGGYMSFGEGLKIGLLIVLIPSVFFGLFDILYTEVIDPSWSQHYYKHIIEDAKRTIPADKLAAELKKLEKQKEMFGTPVMMFLVMAVTVFIVGLIVTILSSLTLMRRKKNEMAV